VRAPSSAIHLVVGPAAGLRERAVQAGWDCNQFLLKDPTSNRYDLVDAGHGLDFERVVANIAAIIEPTRIRRVVVTHEHLDHVNGLPRWRELGAELCASRGVAHKLRAGHDPTSARFGRNIPRLDVDTELADGDSVQLGGDLYQVLETPGHSPGSACFWHESSGVLFTGDTLFAEGGIGRFDFPDGDLRLLYDSVHRLGKLPVRVLHCGHGASPEGEAAARSLRGSMQHVAACRAQAD
jgi:hydroxyacylglutathione hydrolase